MSYLLGAIIALVTGCDIALTIYTRSVILETEQNPISHTFMQNLGIAGYLIIRIIVTLIGLAGLILPESKYSKWLRIIMMVWCIEQIFLVTYLVFA